MEVCTFNSIQIDFNCIYRLSVKPCHSRECGGYPLGHPNALRLNQSLFVLVPIEIGKCRNDD